MKRNVCASLLSGCLLLGCSGSPREKEEAGLDLVQVAGRADEAGDLPKPMPAEQAAAYADISDRLNAGFVLEPGSLDKVIGITFYDCGLRGADLAVLKGFPVLQELNLGKNYRITDAHLEHLEGLTALRSLDLSVTRVTGGGLAHLLPLTELRSLSLDDTYMQDPALLYIARFRKLEALSIRQNRGITDAGLAHLKGLDILKYLNLAFCAGITDKGMAHLKTLTSLKTLDLRQTSVTDAGQADLRKALPKVQFE